MNKPRLSVRWLVAIVGLASLIAGACFYWPAVEYERVRVAEHNSPEQFAESDGVLTFEMPRARMRAGFQTVPVERDATLEEALARMALVFGALALLALAVMAARKIAGWQADVETDPVSGLLLISGDAEREQPIAHATIKR